MTKYATAILTLLIATTLVFSAKRTAFALPDYKKEFFNIYVDKTATEANAKAFAEAANAKTGKCFVCHVNVKKLDEPGLKSKSVRNNYGKAITQFIDKDSFKAMKKEDKEKAMAALREAIEKAGGLKVDPNDPDSPTFAELIESGKLPGDGKPDPDDLEKAKAARDSK
ncbi:MAG: hypothetical protein P8K78_04940 [Pirellulales bacterium]|nr:hypothetical protein [Pirellulales bacterium]